MSKDKEPRQWMEGQGSPYEARDHMDNHPSHGPVIAIVVLVLCVCAVIGVFLTMPSGARSDVARTLTRIVSPNSSSGDNDDDNDNIAPVTTQANASSNNADLSTSDDATLISGNGWQVKLPESWAGQYIVKYSSDGVKYSSDGNCAIISPVGMQPTSGSESDNDSKDPHGSPYLVMFVRANGAKPDAAGDVGSQLAYYVTSQDKTWHLEAWDINVVWLARQKKGDRTPYEDTDDSTWDGLCDTLTGGKVKSLADAQALSKDDDTIASGVSDYVTSLLKPQTRLE